MTFTSERVKIVYLQEVQVFRVFVPWEEERGLSEPRPQVLCFMTKFGKNEFISSDAMSKLRQVIKFDFAWDKWTVLVSWVRHGTYLIVSIPDLCILTNFVRFICFALRIFFAYIHVNTDFYNKIYICICNSISVLEI